MNDPTSSPGWERETVQQWVLAQIKEQRLARRWKIFFRLCWLTLAVAVLWVTLHRSTLSGNTSLPHTALVEIRGEIGSGAETNAEDVVDALRDAFEDEGAQAIVLRINSPGGSPVHAGIINDEIRRLKTKHEKPVYAVVEESCASAAYYIAVASDQIFVDKASIVGSIGVLMDGFGFTGLMDKLGVERRLMTAGENKGFLDPFSPQTKTQRAFAQAMLDQIHQQFIQVVVDFLEVLAAAAGEAEPQPIDHPDTVMRHQGQLSYCQQQKRNDKTRRVLEKAFNPQWADRYIEELLFDDPQPLS